MRASVRGLAIVSLSGMVACGDSTPPPTAPTPSPAATIVRVDIEGAATRDLDFLGATVQLRVVATLSDGSRSDVTADTTWSVSNAAVVSVTPQGMVTAVGYGAGAVRGLYRERGSEITVSVLSTLRSDFRISGTVRDASTGAPIAGALVWRGGADYGTVTDANGAFMHLGGVVSGRTLMVSKFGYDFGRVDIPGSNPPAQLEVRLVPDAQPFIERTVIGTFGAPDATGVPVSVQRIATRAGGLFDAEVVRPDCSSRSRLTIEARSGGQWIPARDMPARCYSRVRFVAPDSEIVLTVHGLAVPGYELVFRESR